MGRTCSEISEQHQAWIERQPVFFVGTAPGDDDGHINISPKGAGDSFAVLGPHTVAYLDMIGSGVETIAHLRDNGRIVLMFCAFEGPPKIIRLHGQGRVVLEQDPEFAALLDRFAAGQEVRSLTRAVIVVNVARVSDSCGYAVPLMDFVGERDKLFRWGETRDAKQGPTWRADYKREKNARSIDQLPRIDPVVSEPSAAGSTSS